MTEQPLKPTGIPNDPNHILRCQYKYTNQKDDYYTLADYEIKYMDDIDDVGISHTNWSKYRYIDEQINSDNEPIISTSTTQEDFHKMIEWEGYEREGREFVITR